MGLVEAFLRERKCPQDGSQLHGKELVCNTCRSTWRGLFEGDATSSGTPIDNRDYLRRKLHELENHQLAPGIAAPQAYSRFLRAGGGTLTTGITRRPAAIHAESLQWQNRAMAMSRIVDGRARQEQMPLLKNPTMPGSTL